MKPIFESVLFDLSEEDDHFYLHVESKAAGEVLVRLSPAVASALAEAVMNAIRLQQEIEKLDTHRQEHFPFEIAQGVIQGRGEFQAEEPEAPAGIFGAIHTQKGN